MFYPYQKRHSRALSFILTTLFLLLIFSPSVAAQGSDWEGVYGVEFANTSDFPDLAGRGVNTVLLTVGTAESNWKSYYDAAVSNNIKLIPMIWGNNQTAWVWNSTAGEWELNITKYPNSIGAKFINFLKTNPAYLARTRYLYAFHEPFNPQGSTVPLTRLQKFWIQIHEQEFPNNQLKLYGEGYLPGNINGSVDVAHIGAYNFAYNGSTAGYRPGSRNGSAYGPFTADLNEATAATADNIDWYYNTTHSASPAPDGSYAKWLFLPGTFAFDNPGMGMWNRMPEAWEMRTWAEKIAQVKKTRLAGFLWYPFRFSSLYDHNLYDDRYDTSGADRWSEIQTSAQILLSGTNPTPTPPPGVPGDANSDGKVNVLDFAVWVQNYGQNLSGAINGDFNNSGQVDMADFAVWINNYE